MRNSVKLLYEYIYLANFSKMNPIGRCLGYDNYADAVKFNASNRSSKGLSLREQCIS